MHDLISRQAAIDAFWKLDIELRPSAIDAITDMLKTLPSAQPVDKDIDVPSNDCISRQAAIEAMVKLNEEDLADYGVDIPEAFNLDCLDRATYALRTLPAAQPTQDFGRDTNVLSTDYISRRAAIDALGEQPDGGDWTDEWECGCRSQWEWDKEAIENVPAAQPKRKTGSWTEKHHAYADEEKVIEEWQSCKCSVCGRYDTRPYLYYFNEPNFCSWCGADMRGGERESEIHSDI